MECLAIMVILPTGRELYSEPLVVELSEVELLELELLELEPLELELPELEPLELELPATEPLEPELLELELEVSAESASDPIGIGSINWPRLSAPGSFNSGSPP